MSADILSAILYAMVGLAVIYLFKNRRKTAGSLDHASLPELSDQDFHDLKILMKTAYERMLYLGVLFFPLAYSTFRGPDQTGTVFFLILIGLLFISNIPPRHKIMRLLERNHISTAELTQRGIRI